MSRNLQQILIDTNSYLDLTAEVPEGDDLAVRINYVQQAVREWADASRWKELSTPINLLATLGTLSLPLDFKELETLPTDVNNQTYPEILAKDVFRQGEGDKYSFLTGNESAGYILTFNNLPSLATISTVYQRSPSNMVTLSDICEVPDDQYVVQKVISLVLQSRSDERFPLVEADANRRLQNMMGRAMNQTPGGSQSIRRTGSGRWKIGRSRG